MGLGNQSQAGKLRVGRSCQKNLGKMDKTNWNRNKTSYTLGTQKEDSSCSYCSALKPGVGLRAPKSQPVKVVQALCQNICVLFLRLCPCWHVGPANPRAQLSRAVLCLQGCNFCVWLHWDFWREGGQESLALEQPSLKDCVLLPWKLVTETTCPGLPLHRSAEQMLKMRGDHLWASQRLLFNVHWIVFCLHLATNAPSSGSFFTFAHEWCPMTCYCEAFLHIQLLCMDPNSLISHWLLLLPFSKRAIYRESWGEAPKHPQHVHISSAQGPVWVVGIGQLHPSPLHPALLLAVLVLWSQMCS